MLHHRCGLEVEMTEENRSAASTITPGIARRERLAGSIVVGTIVVRSVVVRPAVVGSVVVRSVCGPSHGVGKRDKACEVGGVGEVLLANSAARTTLRRNAA